MWLLKRDCSPSEGNKLTRSNSEPTRRLISAEWELRRKSDSSLQTIDPSSLIGLIVMKQWDVLAAIISQYPRLAKAQITVHEKGRKCYRLLIHEVCRHRPSLNIVETLIFAYPTGLKCTDDSNYFLPIHFACRSGASTDIIAKLLQAHPDSYFFKDKYSCTPLTIAQRAAYSHKAEVIEIFEKHASKYAKDSISKTGFWGSVGAKSA